MIKIKSLISVNYPINEINKTILNLYLCNAFCRVCVWYAWTLYDSVECVCCTLEHSMMWHYTSLRSSHVWYQHQRQLAYGSSWTCWSLNRSRWCWWAAPGAGRPSALRPNSTPSPITTPSLTCHSIFTQLQVCSHFKFSVGRWFIAEKIVIVSYKAL